MARFLVGLYLVLCLGHLGCSGCGPEPLAPIERGAEIGVSVRTLDFGVVVIGQENSRTFDVLSRESAALTVQVASSDEQAFVMEPATLNLGPGTGATVTVRFRPEAVRAYEGAIEILSNSVDGERERVVLVGAGSSGCDACDGAPARSCGADGALSSFAAEGQCVDGQCVYEETRELCAFGCDPLNLACLDAEPAGQFYVSPQGDDQNPGTQEDPLRTIGRGLALASASAAENRSVFVCAGRFPERGLSISFNVALQGGYDCESWERAADFGAPGSVSDAESTIENGDFPTTRSTLVVTGAEASVVVVEGFALLGPSTGSGSSAALEITAGANARVEHNRILGGATVADALRPAGSVGVILDNASATLSFNHIEGGAGTGSTPSEAASVGLLVSGSSFPVVHDDEISGGSGTNTIDHGGMGALAVQWDGSGVGEFLRAAVYGGEGEVPNSSGTRAAGFQVRGNGSVEIAESFIHGGGGAPSELRHSHFALNISTGAGAVTALRRNRIYGGDFIGNVGMNWGVLFGGDGEQVVENNLIYAGDHNFIDGFDSANRALRFGGGGYRARVHFNSIYASHVSPPNLSLCFELLGGGTGPAVYLNNNMCLIENTYNSAPFVGINQREGLPALVQEFSGNALVLGDGNGTTAMINYPENPCGGPWERTSSLAFLEACFNREGPDRAVANQEIAGVDEVFATWVNHGWDDFLGSGWTLKPSVDVRFSEGAVALPVDLQPTLDHAGQARTIPYSIGALEHDE